MFLCLLYPSKAISFRDKLPLQDRLVYKQVGDFYDWDEAYQLSSTDYYEKVDCTDTSVMMCEGPIEWPRPGFKAPEYNTNIVPICSNNLGICESVCSP